MATSYTAFARHRLVNEANLQSQNISANTSVVVGALYLQSMDAYGAISAGAIGQARVTINGVNQYENANSTVSANQKKLLLAKQYTVGHDAAGKSSPAVSAQYYVNVTFAGVYYGTVSVGTWGMGALPTIPRHSSLNSIPTFQVPNGCSFSISRKSTFTHNLSFWVQNTSSPNLTNDSHWTWLMDVKNVATSGTFNFSTAQMKTIAARINQYNPGGGNISGKVKLWTNGVSGLSAQRTVSITSPAAATPNPSNLTLKAGNNLWVGYSNRHSNARFTYDIKVDCAGWSKTWTDLRDALSYPLTQTDVDNIQSRFTGSTSNGAIATITSKLDGQQYRTAYNKSFTVSVDSSLSSPQVNTTFTPTDTNSASVAITGSNQIMLQNVSTMRVTVPSSALTARGYGSLKTVEVSFGGVNKSLNYTSGNMIFDFGAVKNSSGSVTVKVTDSRGLSGSNSKEVTIYPFQYPVIDAIVQRQNNFESIINIAGTVSYTPSIPNNKYQVGSIYYQLNNGSRQMISSSSVTPGIINLTPISTILDTSITGTVKIIVVDSLGETTRSYSIGKGKPILFINSYKESVSIGNLTGTSYNGTLPGLLEFEAERYHSTGKTGIQMNNSDISGVKGIWFSTDTMNNSGEGLHFIRSGAEANVTSPDFYDYLYMRDGGVYVNSDTNPIFTVSDDGKNMMYGSGWLWLGGNWPNPNQTITPAKKLSECRNGWMLMWAKYDSGTTYDTDIVFTPVHKGSLKNGTQWRRFLISSNADTIGVKALHIYDNYLVGARDNSSSALNNSKIVLRAVFEF